MRRRFEPKRRMAWRAVAALLLAILGAVALPAQARVRLGFHTREDGGPFPHAFIVLRGALDATGESVDTNAGFTPLAISPMILTGPMKGEVSTNPPAYVRRSREHFALDLTDEQYWRVLERIEQWRRQPQPSFRLDQRNCVHFVADIAAVVGLDAEVPLDLARKPRTFLDRVRDRNQALVMRLNPVAVASAEPAR